MRKVVLGILGVLGVAIVAVLAMASGKPDTIHVERSITIAATPADMAPFAEDLEKVNAWSPWEEKDPNVKKSYSDSTTGVGSWYAWEGNEEVGKGKQIITSSEPGKVVHRLEFIEPFESQADATISYAAAGDNVEVTWGFDTDAPMMMKVMQTLGVVDMEAQLGPDFQKGLDMLKPLVEAAAKERSDAAAKAAAEAAAKEAAEADGADGGEAAPQ